MGMFSVTLLASDNSANASTVLLDANFVQDVSVPTAGEVASFPTAAAAIVYQHIDQNTQRTRRYLTASTQAAIGALINASNLAVGSGVSGQTTLAAGTKAITIPGLTTSSIALVSLVSSANGALTVTYQAVCTANTLTLRANIAAGTINNVDTSVVNYAIVG